MRKCFASSFALFACAVATAAALLLVGVEAEQRLRDMRQLHSAARRLESAETLALEAGERATKERERRQLLAAFVGEPKGEASERSHRELSKLADDYRARARQFVDECQRNNANWFTKIISFGGPMGAMRAMGRPHPLLSSISERLEAQCKAGKLTGQLVDRWLAKFRLSGLEAILFVLETDVKCLATESVQLINWAIYTQLRQSKFVASNNFYDVEQLSESQRKLLADFYLARAHLEASSVADALEHFSEPSNLIIGRLLDSCHSMHTYLAERAQTLASCGAECSADQLAEHHLDVGRFCDQFLEAL